MSHLFQTLPAETLQFFSEGAHKTLMPYAQRTFKGGYCLFLRRFHLSAVSRCIYFLNSWLAVHNGQEIARVSIQNTILACVGWSGCLEVVALDLGTLGPFVKLANFVAKVIESFLNQKRANQASLSAILIKTEEDTVLLHYPEWSFRPL